jgi:predicted membrane protein
MTVQAAKQGLMRSILYSLFAALLTALLSTGLAWAYFLTLPTPSSTASLETLESYALWKKALYVPVGLTALVVAPITAALAKFVSLYTPRPISFVMSLTIIASVAGITHLTSSPLKGPANIPIVLLSVAVCAILIFGLGFLRERDATTNPLQTP